MPSADFCSAVRPPFDGLSRRSDTEQISWGKLSRLLCTVALGGHFKTGHRGSLQNRPTEPSSWTNLFYPIGHWFGKPSLIQSGCFAGPDSSLSLPSSEGELGNLSCSFLLRV